MTRTTIRLDEHLLHKVKEVAAKSGRTFTDVVADALREVVNRVDAPARRTRIELPTFRGDGLQPGVDLNDNASVRDLMDEGVPLEKLR